MEILQIHWIPFIDYKTLSKCITVFTIQASQIGNQIWSDCFLSNLPCVVPSCIHIKPLLYQLYKAPFMNFPVPRKSQPHLQLNLYKQSQDTALIPGPHNVRLLSTGADYWSPDGVPQEEQQNDDHDDNSCYFSVRGPQIQVAGVLPVFLRNDW